LWEALEDMEINKIVGSIGRHGN